MNDCSIQLFMFAREVGDNCLRQKAGDPLETAILLNNLTRSCFALHISGLLIQKLLPSARITHTQDSENDVK